jgi:hypothetical protein
MDRTFKTNALLIVKEKKTSSFLKFSHHSLNNKALQSKHLTNQKIERIKKIFRG